MSTLNYINYLLPYDKINEKLIDKNRINIYIDLNSIAKGFYNRTIILKELNFYVETSKISDKFIIELKDYLTRIYNNFKSKNPRFIIFYDKGISSNTSIDPNYKANRTNNSKGYIQTDDEIRIYYAIKDYYFDKVYHNFKKKNLCSVIYLENIETDLIPHYIIKRELIKSGEKDTLNLILSVDKDLMQTCCLNNTYQAVCLYSNKDRQFHVELYDNYNSAGYIMKRPTTLTSDYIPLLLAISGDKSDNIAGVSGIGPIKAEKLITSNNLNNTVFKNTVLPPEISSYKSKIMLNMQLISFSEQESRLPASFNNKIINELSILFDN